MKGCGQPLRCTPVNILFLLAMHASSVCLEESERRKRGRGLKDPRSLQLMRKAVRRSSLFCCRGVRLPPVFSSEARDPQSLVFVHQMSPSIRASGVGKQVSLRLSCSRIHSQ